ncbi:MAG: DNA polymerase III subunit alpha, partial [Planctomycetales bacterium]|nr:DNA polymerase III subunit alpha [Planctomycetales bacterium]
QKMKPDHFRDIIATNALYRPGPLEGGMVEDYVAVKHGRKEAEYKHPVLKDVLEETNGIMVYQEQVMRILNRLGGLPLAGAYTCIKAISKKKESLISKNYEQFIAGAVDKGMARDEAQEIWDLIIKFAGYGFNKSHSTAYALIAYQTAYLKAHFPVEFMAALLSGDIPGRNFKRKDSLVEHMEDCARMGIEVVNPDVNLSDVDFSVNDGKIHFGLSAIKGCGGGASESIVAARKQGGPFKDLFDFCERVDPSSCNRSAIETLIKGVAFDAFGALRSQLNAIVERAIQAGASAAADRKSGQKSLFGGFDEEEEKQAASVSLPDIPEWEEREKLVAEKEVLGFYLSSHPLAEYEQKLKAFCTHSTTSLAGVPDRAEVIMGGMIGAIKMAHTKNGKPGAPTKYANFDLEDMDGVIRCIAWPDGYAQFGQHISADNVLVIRGALDRRGGDEANLIVNEIIPLDELDSRYTSGIKIRIDERHHGDQVMPRIREVVRTYPGNCELQFLLMLKDGSRCQLRSQNTRVEVNAEFRTRLDDLLGAGNYQLITSAPKL